MPNTPTDAEKREHLRKIINDSHSGMFVTRRPDGTMHGRPMANAQVGEDFGSLWFATSRSSAKASELRSDDHVFLGYNNSSGTEWAAVNGRGRVVDDRAKARELWEPMWKNWWDSPDDPELVLIEVTPESAEYWDMGNRLVAAVKFAIGTITGKDMTANHNQKVNLAN
jgi:general stress protein 26